MSELLHRLRLTVKCACRTCRPRCRALVRVPALYCQACNVHQPRKENPR
jgi:hypothetical protein